MNYLTAGTDDLYALIAQHKANPEDDSDQVIAAAEHEIGCRYGWATRDEPPPAD